MEYVYAVGQRVRYRDEECEVSDVRESGMVVVRFPDGSARWTLPEFLTPVNERVYEGVVEAQGGYWWIGNMSGDDILQPHEGKRVKVTVEEVPDDAPSEQAE